MKFDADSYRYPSRRGLVYGTRGMVATSQPLAAQAGLDMLKKGGNAVDAAIAAAACMTVVEPTSNGLGSDSFTQVWMDGKLYGLNASGYSPKSLDAETVRALGHKTMPRRGWIPVMVPGAVAYNVLGDALGGDSGFVFSLVMLILAFGIPLAFWYFGGERKKLKEAKQEES